MTNTHLLERKISESGYKRMYLAEQLNISGWALKMKVDNVHEFKASEIKKLCKLLQISDQNEINAIFFAEQVE